MTILQIEHAINDLDTWMKAFDRFGDARRQAGVRAHRINRLADDPDYLVIELDFDSAPEAARFRQFLMTNVWAVPENSPALAGTPETRILETVTAG